MAFNIKEIMAKKRSRFLSGHRMCSGCGVPPAIRLILRALKNEDHAVISSATGCLEVSSAIYPQTSWTDSYIHTAFASAPSAISGVEAAYLVRKKKNIDVRDTKFLVIAGDGGTYDIGLQSMSAMFERGHDVTFVCYDNGGYMNTGIQRSSATPEFASTTTTPGGKIQKRKDISKIAAAHNIPYIAQTALFLTGKDLYEKAQKAIYTNGPTFLNVFTPCPLGWKYDEDKMKDIIQSAIDTCFWPIYEVIDGRYVINYKPREKKPIEEFLKLQRRFNNMFKKENAYQIEEMQKEVDRRWQELLNLEKITNITKEDIK